MLTGQISRTHGCEGYVEVLHFVDDLENKCPLLDPCTDQHTSFTKCQLLTNYPFGPDLLSLTHLESE